MMHRLLIALALWPLTAFSTAIELKSPDSNWRIAVETTPRITLKIGTAGDAVVLTQEIGLQLSGGLSLFGGVPKRVLQRSVDETVHPVVPTKAAVLQDRYSEAVLQFPNGLFVEVRAYDTGVAYRFATTTSGHFVVESEKQLNAFAASALVRMGTEKSFYSHNEVSYQAGLLSERPPGMLTSLPILIQMQNNGPRLVISETALESYPGQWLRVSADGKFLEGVWPAYPIAEKECSDRDIAVTERAKELARSKGPRAFPWRFVAMAKTDGDLLLNPLAYLLADEPRIKDTTWIKPGKVQWDWWHDFNVWDTQFAGGVSQNLYKHYIDFAAANNARYVILDEGWYPLGDLTSTERGIDIPELVAYGRSKGVGVILWASWATLKKQFDTFMPLAERWGIAGLKVDFFQRDDQIAVEFYWKLAAEAAKRRLLLDFHGAHKPAGLQRAYPNVLTFEGVKGLEHNKWSTDITAEHDTTLPFVRQVAGPMDYTPGAMDNAQATEFRPIKRRPMSQGTRAHQLAQYVIYESPLQMYADSPSAYRANETSMKFMREIPVVWDETRVLAGEIGKVAALARRSGDRWFIGVLNGANTRELDLDLDFLPSNCVLEVWKDGVNADRDGRDVSYLPAVDCKDGSVKVVLAPGGGWVAIVRTRRSH